MRASGPDRHPGDSRADIRTRLGRALTEALKARDAAAVSALRSALGAIGNAEAVDPREPRPGRPAASGSAHLAGAAAGLRAAGLRHGTRALLEVLGDGTHGRDGAHG